MLFYFSLLSLRVKLKTVLSFASSRSFVFSFSRDFFFFFGFPSLVRNMVVTTSPSKAKFYEPEVPPMGSDIAEMPGKSSKKKSMRKVLKNPPKLEIIIKSAIKSSTSSTTSTPTLTKSALEGGGPVSFISIDVFTPTGPKRKTNFLPNFEFGDESNKSSGEQGGASTAAGGGRASFSELATRRKSTMAGGQSRSNSIFGLGAERRQSRNPSISVAGTTERGGSVSGPGGVGGGGAGAAPITITQEAPTSLPQEFIALVKSFRHVADAISTNPAVPLEESKHLSIEMNKLIRYLSSFLLQKYTEELQLEARKALGWAKGLSGTSSPQRSSKQGSPTGSLTSPAGAEAQLGPAALQMMHNILQMHLSVVRCDRASIFVPDARTGELISIVMVGSSATVKSIRVPQSQGVAGAVFQTGIGMNVINTGKVSENIFTRNVDNRTGYFSHSILCLPLRKKNSSQLFGVVMSLNKFPPHETAHPTPPTTHDGSPS